MSLHAKSFGVDRVRIFVGSYTSEPKVGVPRRMWVEFLSWLPIEWLL